MKILRYFPRKTKATPDDTNVFIGNRMPTLFDEADEIHISVTWTWDKPHAERMAKVWSVVAPVKIGGPAYGNPGGEFEPGMYLKKGYVITSRGCPNHCWFCRVPKQEGVLREIEIKDGWNVLDNNLLACSKNHIERVFKMLEKQSHRINFSGGLEAARLEDWHVEWLARLKPKSAWFAYDTPNDWGPLVLAADLLKQYKLIGRAHTYRCYVLVGWLQDTLEKADRRLQDVAKLGLMPMAMLLDHGESKKNDKEEWIHFARNWANPFVVGAKMKSFYPQVNPIQE
jgi:hypothetical protein